LDSIVSALERKPSTTIATSRQEFSSDSVEDADDDIALPLILSSPQQKMSAALLSGHQPVRSTTEAEVHMPVSCDQRVQAVSSPGIGEDENDTPENLDDDDDDDNDGLVGYDVLLRQRLHNGSATKAPPAQDTDESEGRPKKKQRVE
jgi:hypothetical protein